MTDTLSRALGIARAAAGIGVCLAPRLAGQIFAGQAGTTPAVTLFARGFGVRDLVIGANLAHAARHDPAYARPWLFAACIADTGDTIAAILALGRQPRRAGRTAVVASAVPALIEAATLANRSSARTG